MGECSKANYEFGAALKKKQPIWNSVKHGNDLAFFISLADGGVLLWRGPGNRYRADFSIKVETAKDIKADKRAVLMILREKLEDVIEDIENVLGETN